MISSAFKSAALEETRAKQNVVGTATAGVKDLATGIVGALGFAGVGGDAFSTAAQHALAGRVGGIGGNLMLASMEEKIADAKEYDLMRQGSFTREEVGSTIKSQLGDNPINRAAIKQLDTVFNTLQRAKEENIIKDSQIKSSIGDIDPNSELGKKVLGGLANDNDR